MTRGFTLLEFVITLMFLVVMLLVAVPSFQSVMETVRMQRLASELNGFLIQAKSEAITRNQKLYAHFSFPQSPAVRSDGNWNIELTDNQTAGAGNSILNLDGSSFNAISIKHQLACSTCQYISFGKLRGGPSQGVVYFYPENNISEVLEAVTFNRSGRIKICGGVYGYPDC